jgi:hypothetical protein
VTNGLNNYIAGNGCYDSSATIAGACVYFNGGSKHNIAIINLGGANGLFSDYVDSGGDNSIQLSGATGFQAAHEVAVTDVAATDVYLSTYLNGTRKWSLYNQATNNYLGLYDWTNAVFRLQIMPGGDALFHGSDLVSDALTGDASVSTSIAGVKKWSWYNTATTGHFGLYDRTNSLFIIDISPGNVGTTTINGSELISNAATGDAVFSLARAGAHKWALYNPAASNLFGIYDWTAGAFKVTIAQSTGAVNFPGSTVLQVAVIATVAGLPTCNGAAEGTRSQVNNALAPAALSTVAGGGAVHVSVYCNGTNWIVQ